MEGNPSEIYDVFSYIDTQVGHRFTDPYKRYFLIQEWGQLIDPFDETKFSREVILPDYVSGDVNADGEADAKDAALLRRYVAGWQVRIGVLASDLNGDEKIDGKDAALLRRQVAGWNVPD